MTPRAQPSLYRAAARLYRAAERGRRLHRPVRVTLRLAPDVAALLARTIAHVAREAERPQSPKLMKA